MIRSNVNHLTAPTLYRRHSSDSSQTYRMRPARLVAAMASVTEAYSKIAFWACLRTKYVVPTMDPIWLVRYLACDRVSTEASRCHEPLLIRILLPAGAFF
jgi:hypothetical protein